MLLLKISEIQCLDLLYKHISFNLEYHLVKMLGVSEGSELTTVEDKL